MPAQKLPHGGIRKYVHLSGIADSSVFNGFPPVSLLFIYITIGLYNCKARILSTHGTAILGNAYSYNIWMDMLHKSRDLII